MSIKVKATLISKASKDSVWKAMEDFESYPKWADSTKKTRMVSCKIVSREGNTVVCDVDELVGGHHGKHRDKITLYPKDRCDSEFISGALRGTTSWSCTETPQGTRIDMSFDVEPNTLGAKMLGLFTSLQKMLQGIAEEYCKQLSEYAEAHPALVLTQ
jgi:hypothetical protein